MIQFLYNLGTNGTQSPSLSSCFSGQVPSSSTAKVEQYSFSSFAALKVHSERRKKRIQIAADIFKRISEMCLPTNWRQFALMHDHRIIRETSLEGAPFQTCIQVALGYFEALQKGADFIFSVSLSEEKKAEIVNEITSALHQMNKFLSFLPASSNTPQPKEVLERTTQKIIKEIQSVFAKKPKGNKVTYLPLFYLPGKKNDAHSMVCKLTELDKEVEVQLFNLGNGANLHPKIDFDLNKEKRSFVFPPLKVSKDLFYGRQGQIAFSTLLRYQLDIPQGNVSYDAYDIYDIFIQLAKCSNPKTEIVNFEALKPYAAEEQVSGNCPDVAVTNVINDILIRHKVDSVNQTKIHLNRHFSSLIHHFQVFKKEGVKEKDRTVRELIYEAVRVLQCTILDLRKQIQCSESELIISLSALEAVVSGMKKIMPVRSIEEESSKKEEESKQGMESVSGGKSSSYKTAFPILPQLEKTSRNEKVSKSDVINVSFYAVDPPAFPKMERFLPQLNEWIATASNLPKERVFDYVSDLVRCFPIPQRIDEGVKDVWEELPIREIPKVLQSLVKLAHEGLIRSDVAKPFTDQFMLVYALYSITDKLARRCPECKLKGFASPFLPYLVKFEPEEFISFPLREDNERYIQLRYYFTKRNYLLDERSKEPVIFPVAPQLNVHQFVEDMFSGKCELERIQGVGHIIFLSQFTNHSRRERVAEQYCSDWLSMLPEQVRVLYYFSFLSHSLFFATAYSKELKFKSAEEAGRPYLMLESPIGSYSVSSDTYERKFTEVSFPYIHRDTDGSRGSLNHRIIDFFSSKVRALTTNQTVCFQMKKRERESWNISDQGLRKCLYMKHFNLMIFQAIQEFTLPEGIGLLEHDGVRQKLDSCIFYPGILLERLREEPKAILDGFRRMIRNGLEYHQSNMYQFQTTIFLLRMGICFETYTSRDSERQKMFDLYAGVISELFRMKPVVENHFVDILSIEVFLQTVCHGSLDRQTEEAETKEIGAVQSVESWSKLFTKIFELYVFKVNQDPGWIAKNLPKFLRKNAYGCFPLLSNKQSRDAICSHIMNHFLKNGFSGSWNGNFPQYSCGDYVIDFFDGSITHRKHQCKLQKLYVIDSSLRELWKDHIAKHGDIFWVNEQGKKVSLDGAIYFCPIKQQWLELVADPVLGKSTQQMLTFYRTEDINEIDQQGHSFFNWSGQWRTYRADNGDLTVYDNKTNSPYMHVRSQKGQLEFARLDAAAKPLSYVRVNTSALSKSDPLYRYTRRFIGDEGVLCFVEKDNPRKIVELNFYRQNLEFIGRPALNGRQKFECTQMPGKHLIATVEDLSAFENSAKLKEEWEQILLEINQFDRAFILYDAQKQKWSVLFPNCKLALGAEDFSNEVEGLANATSSKKNVHHFEFDPKECRLVCTESDLKKSVTAQLYLVLVFKMQRDYEKAENYLHGISLQEVQRHQGFQELHKPFETVKDHSIASIVFNLRLVLFFLRAENLLTEQHFKNGQGTDIRWGMRLYNAYLQQQVPENLRLSLQEQRKLLYAFRKYYIEYYKNRGDWNVKWREEQPILNAHYNMLFGNSSVTIEPKEQELFLSPPCFAFFKFDEFLRDLRYAVSYWIEGYERNPVGSGKTVEYPIRMSLNHVIANLFTFFERAKKGTKGDPEFIWILHAILKGEHSGSTDFSCSNIGTMLFIVYHFPDQFQKLSLPATVEAKGAETFKNALEIVLVKAQSIAGNRKEPRFVEFMENTVKCSQKYNLPTRAFRVPPKKEEVEPCPQRSAQPENPCNLHVDELRARIKQAEREIYSLFNDHYKRYPLMTSKEVEEEALFLCQRIGSRILPATRHSKEVQQRRRERKLPELLLQHVIRKNDLKYLRTQRPMLDSREMHQLCTKVCEWVNLQSALRLKEQHREGLYVEHDYQRYPGINSYFLKTDQFPREKQIGICKTVTAAIPEKRSCHIQSGAGEGKTSVSTPLLFLIALENHLTPVSFVPAVSYPRDKHNLTQNLNKQGIRVGYFEVGMHMIGQLTAAHLEDMYSELRRLKSEGAGLITTKEAYYTIYLIRNLACHHAVTDEAVEKQIIGLEQRLIKLGKQFGYADGIRTLRYERSQKILWAQHILNFFKRECMPIFDESDEILDSLTCAIYGIDFIALPADQRHHILDMMHIYLGVKKVPQTDNIETCKKEYREKRDKVTRRNLRLALAESYLPLCKISHEERQIYLDWWTNKKAPKPASLVAENPLAKKIALTSRFLEIIPGASSLKTDVDHGRSPYPNKKYDVPAKDRKVSGREYADAQKAYAVTVKGDYERGLTLKDIEDLIKKLIKLNQSEKRNGVFTGDSSETPTNAVFKKWIKGSPLEHLNLNGIDTDNKEIMNQLFALLSKHPGVLDFWLRNLQGVGSSRFQLQCSVVNLFNGFNQTAVAFSATPHTEEAYPIKLRRGKDGDYSNDKQFAVAVRNKLKESQNSRSVVLNDGDPFWETMQRDHPKYLQEATVLIDPRDFFSTRDNQDLATKWMTFNPTLDGVIFCNSSQEVSIDKEDKMILLLKDGKKHSICGNDIIAIFKDLGLDWHKLNVGTIYDPENIRALHVLQKKGALAFFFMGDGMTTIQLIQALMRLRGFLDDQTVLQVYRQSVKMQIFQSRKPSSELLLQWTDANEKRHEEKNIIMNAFADIRYAIALQAELNLEKAHLECVQKGDMDMTAVIDAFRMHKHGLVDETEIDPYIAFGDHEILTNTRTVLESYARITYARYAYGITYEEAVKDKVNEIITGIESQIKEIYSKAQNHVAKSVEQQVQVKVEMQKHVEHQTTRVMDPQPLDGKYGEVKIYDPEYLRVQKIPGKTFSSFLTDGFYFEENQMITARTQDNNSSNILKPIQFLIVTIYKENGVFKWKAHASTNEILTNDLYRMINCPEKVDGLEHTVFMVGVNGKLIQKGKGALTPPQQIVDEILNSQWLQDVCADASLLSGRIFEPEALLKRIEKTGWEVFDELWKKVLSQLNDESQAYTTVYNRMKKGELADDYALTLEDS